jgi:hypothetical protein
MANLEGGESRAAALATLEKPKTSESEAIRIEELLE